MEPRGQLLHLSFNWKSLKIKVFVIKRCPFYLFLSILYKLLSKLFSKQNNYRPYGENKKLPFCSDSFNFLSILILNTKKHLVKTRCQLRRDRLWSPAFLDTSHTRCRVGDGYFSTSKFTSSILYFILRVKNINIFLTIVKCLDKI